MSASLSGVATSRSDRFRSPPDASAAFVTRVALRWRGLATSDATRCSWPASSRVGERTTAFTPAETRFHVPDILKHCYFASLVELIKGHVITPTRRLNPPCYYKISPPSSGFLSGSSSALRIPIMMGRRKASVLPDPVGAMANTSRPPMMAGMAWRWMGEGSVTPSSL